jgi:hypothetical protein
MPEDIFETILKLVGSPKMNASYLPNIKVNQSTGEARVSYGETDSSLDKIGWQYKTNGD